MSTFIERIKEAIALTTTAQVSESDALELDKVIQRRIKSNKITFDLLQVASKITGIPVVEPVDLELEGIQLQCRTLWDRARHARLRLTVLEREQTQDGRIKIISTNPKGVQLVIHYLRDDGKKVSYTRHCRVTNEGYVGLSTISTAKVIYRPAVAVAEAA